MIKLINQALLLLVTLVVLHQTASAQRFDSTTQWRLYSMVDRDAFLVAEDSLQQLPSMLIPNDRLEIFIRKLDSMPSNRPQALQSAYLLSYKEVSGKTVKVLASGAGNYLYIGRHKKYWAIPETLKAEWLEFLTELYQQFP